MSGFKRHARRALASDARGASTSTRRGAAEPQPLGTRIRIAAPDDWHLHLRDGADALRDTVAGSAAHFRRAIVMPNLVPPVTTVDMAAAYKSRIARATPEAHASTFQPLMTLYLTDDTTPEEVHRAKESGIIAGFKLYPAGATTNSASGVTDIGKCRDALAAMEAAGLVLLVHGEVVDPEVDIFDRERLFIDRVLRRVLDAHPHLRVVMEHITTRDAAEFVRSCDATQIAATVTPQHVLLNRNALLVGGIRPHHYCLPVLKRETHRAALTEHVTSGSSHFFLGTDSAPHRVGDKESACGCAGIFSSPVAMAVYAKVFEERGALDKLEGFASLHGPQFYGLAPNASCVTLVKQPWVVPERYTFGEDTVRPLMAGEELAWRVET